MMRMRITMDDDDDEDDDGVLTHKRRGG